jgi:hypothetical protein
MDPTSPGGDEEQFFDVADSLDLSTGQSPPAKSPAAPPQAEPPVVQLAGTDTPTEAVLAAPEAAAAETQASAPAAESDPSAAGQKRGILVFRSCGTGHTNEKRRIFGVVFVKES